MKVGLSGTGRIGRLFLRRWVSEQRPDIEVAVVNTLTKPAVLAHLLKYDSVHGIWDADIAAGDGEIVINGRRIAIVSEPAPERIPWRRYGVSLVIDATGKFNNRAGAEQHLSAGAERVLLTAPGQGMDLTVVMGVNETSYDPDRHLLLSAASCTTNCLAPILHLIDRRFGIERGWMTTIHAFTNDQNHMDNSHTDLRRARACTQSIIPTTTGVQQALSGVLPHLAGSIQGQAVRVPTSNVSLLDLSLDLNTGGLTKEAVQEAIRSAVQGDLGHYVGYNELPLVSTDYIGNDKSAIIDGLSIMTQDHQVKLLAWYDNEWAYASRVYDLAGFIADYAIETKGADSQWTTKTVS